MNYIDVQKGMTKVAIPSWLLKLGPRAAKAEKLNKHVLKAMRDPKIIKAFRAGKHPRLLRRILNTPDQARLNRAIALDATSAPFRAGGKGSVWLLKYLTGNTNVAPGFKAVAGRAGTAAFRLAGLDLLASAVSPSWRNTQLGWLNKGWNKATDKGAQGVQKIVKALDTPTQTALATTKFSPEALVSTFNPFSGLTGGKDYVPVGLVSAIQKVLPGHKGELAAHAVTKAGASALLAAGLIGAYRTARHIGDLGAVDSKGSAGKGMSGHLSTTFSGNLGDGKEDEEQKKVAAEGDIMAPANFSAQNLTGTALPLASMLLASALTYKGVDYAFDKLRNKRLDNAIAQKEQAVKNLITARARLAKGDLTDANIQEATAPLKDKDIYTKAASQDKEAVVQEGVQLFGTLSAALLLASAIGSYAYTSASDENNLKYKAYKKALREYAKNKSGMTPITVAPKDAPSYFAAIDAAREQKPDTPRSLPSYDADALNKPISVSF